MMANEPLTGGQGFPPDNKDGTPGLVGPDEYTRELRRQYAEKRPQAAVVGNLADLHRLGTQAANSGSDPAFALAPGVDTKDAISGIEAEGKVGLYNRETERYGLVDAPPEPVPPENKRPHVVDPTSVSPRAESRTGSGTSTSTAVKKEK